MCLSQVQGWWVPHLFLVSPSLLARFHSRVLEAHLTVVPCAVPTPDALLDLSLLWDTTLLGAFPGGCHTLRVIFAVKSQKGGLDKELRILACLYGIKKSQYDFKNRI